MSLVNTLRFMLTHPLNSQNKIKALVRYTKWQIGSRCVPGPAAVNFVNDSRLLVRRDMSGANGAIYFGLHEFEDMAFVLHLLRECDVFVDIGANVGSYTVLSSGVIGATTISVEPIPSTFLGLIDNININHTEDKVTALNIGVGSQEGSLFFSSSFGCTNHVIAKDESVENKVEAPISTVDSILPNQSPTLIKIDVEGFETEVIAGSDRSLSNESLLAVIMELNGSGDRYGYNEHVLHERMLTYGFQPFSYVPFERRLVSLDDRGNTGNTLYIRNVEQVFERIFNAPKFRVLSREI